MGSFNKSFNEYAKDGYISAEEIQALGKKWSAEKNTGRPGEGEFKRFIDDEKGFWKKFKKSYKKNSNGDKLGIAGVKGGDLSKESLVNAYNNPSYGKPEEDKKGKKDKGEGSSLPDGYEKYEGSEEAKQHNEILKVSQARVPTEMNVTSRESVKDQIEETKDGLKLQGANIESTGENQYKVGKSDANKLKIDRGTYSKEEIIAARQKYENAKYIEKHYGGDSSLPNRPKAPKMPTLRLPGGLKKEMVDKPSGLPGKIAQYTARGNYNYKDKDYNPSNNKYNVKDNTANPSLSKDYNRAMNRSMRITGKVEGTWKGPKRYRDKDKLGPVGGKKKPPGKEWGLPTTKPGQGVKAPLGPSSNQEPTGNFGKFTGSAGKGVKAPPGPLGPISNQKPTGNFPGLRGKSGKGVKLTKGKK